MINLPITEPEHLRAHDQLSVAVSTQLRTFLSLLLETSSRTGNKVTFSIAIAIDSNGMRINTIRRNIEQLIERLEI